MNPCCCRRRKRLSPGKEKFTRGSGYRRYNPGRYGHDGDLRTARHFPAILQRIFFILFFRIFQVPGIIIPATPGFVAPVGPSADPGSFTTGKQGGSDIFTDQELFKFSFFYPVTALHRCIALFN